MKPRILSISVIIAGAASLLTCSPSLQAQAPAAPNQPVAAQQKPTLLSMLSGVQIEPDQVITTVDGEKARPLPVRKDVSTLPTLTEIASLFGDTVSAFGRVQAVGAQNMDVLNQNPADPNIWDGIPPQDAAKIFIRHRHSPVNGDWYGIWSSPDTPLPDTTVQPPNRQDEKQQIAVVSPTIIRNGDLNPAWNGFMVDLSAKRLDFSTPEKTSQFINDLGHLTSH